MNTPDDRIRRQLKALPDMPPASGLWPRLAEARARRLRRVRMGAGGAAALALCLMLPMLYRLQQAPAQVQAGAAAGPMAVPVEDAAALDAATLVEIRAVDRALQAAYDEGASEAELAPLWKFREALLGARRDPSHSGTPERS
jgi:hypothetical protein